ncbi:hypothetical protein CC1G_10159 [Coprinopsis cinerea okayama7|uniref:Uncharacterized protein n=1 Tax=Coprinopsis cinerea (strain Okayama-7 / 130 / ATCC MYA-4618 / FGSC 9003) TaxID=240176 RepID=A8PEF6_COPC7|nr:hypothetical protein CC1G_10159 [Coprinopsis cinerea okayama7\|eukprot:XP_001840785.2 hypothetical protein CC1G_10159 [Coprinopsis cinerea okayama7\
MGGAIESAWQSSSLAVFKFLTLKMKKYHDSYRDTDCDGDAPSKLALEYMGKVFTSNRGEIKGLRTCEEGVGPTVVITCSLIPLCKGFVVASSLIPLCEGWEVVHRHHRLLLDDMGLFLVDDRTTPGSVYASDPVLNLGFERYTMVDRPTGPLVRYTLWARVSVVSTIRTNANSDGGRSALARRKQSVFRAFPTGRLGSGLGNTLVLRPCPIGARRAERTCDSGRGSIIIGATSRSQAPVASEGILDVDGRSWRATSADLERSRESDVSLAFRVADLLSPDIRRDRI